MAAFTNSAHGDPAEAMAETPLLSSLPRPAVEELAGQGRLRRYRRGTYLYHQGEESEQVYFLWSGRVEVSSTSFTGQRQLLTTLDPPQFFGELGVLGEQPR